MTNLRMVAEVKNNSTVVGLTYNELEKDGIFITRIVRKVGNDIEADNPSEKFKLEETISAGDEIEFTGENQNVISIYKKCIAKE